jgi:hypothetical protein
MIALITFIIAVLWISDEQKKIPIEEKYKAQEVYRQK